MLFDLLHINKVILSCLNIHECFLNNDWSYILLMLMIYINFYQRNECLWCFTDFRSGGTSERQNLFLNFHFWGSKGRMLVPVGATFDYFSTFTCKWNILNPQLYLSLVWCQNSLWGNLVVHEIVHMHLQVSCALLRLSWTHIEMWTLL